MVWNEIFFIDVSIRFSYIMRFLTMQRIVKKHGIFLKYDYFHADENYIEISGAIILNDKTTAELV
jgi:hypothetical protein